MSELASILVVDDEPIMQEILGDFLREEGYEVDVAGSGEEGLDRARQRFYDCAIVDLMMPGIDGIETMQELREIDPSLPVVMVTAFASVESAVEAMKQGAYEYITKPFKNDEVLVVLQNAIRTRRLEDEVKSLRKAVRLDPTRAVLHNDLVVVLSLQSKSGEAVGEYRSAVSLNERYPERRTEEWTTSYYNLGIALRKNAHQAAQARERGAAVRHLGEARQAFLEYTRLNATGPKVHEARDVIDQISVEILQFEAHGEPGLT